ncbi:hypothetical protein RRG08_056285 [Elysia crispata]|uniref:Uncharacterized protein n=1 Tax=Elysia crispata TaxID=231223 RepID=A0AAE1E5K5_9GAST|nr:hypothetical protein RRG08_056285 [Elysia crispata]
MSDNNVISLITNINVLLELSRFLENVTSARRAGIRPKLRRPTERVHNIVCVLARRSDSSGLTGAVTPGPREDRNTGLIESAHATRSTTGQLVKQPGFLAFCQPYPLYKHTTLFTIQTPTAQCDTLNYWLIPAPARCRGSPVSENQSQARPSHAHGVRVATRLVIVRASDTSPTLCGAVNVFTSSSSKTAMSLTLQAGKHQVSSQKKLGLYLFKIKPRVAANKRK